MTGITGFDKSWKTTFIDNDNRFKIVKENNLFNESQLTAFTQDDPA